MGGGTATGTAPPAGQPVPYDPNLAADGDVSTWWIVNAPDAIWTYDFGLANDREITQVTIFARNDAGPEMAPTSFTVESSYDGNIWVAQGGFSGLSWSLGQQQTFSFGPQSNDVFIGADRVDYLDTFLVFNKPKTPQFLVSNSLSVTFDPLDFANKSGGSDLLVTLCVAKREIWLLGQFTSEVWYNTGGDGTILGSFQFQPMSGVFIPHGIVAKYSVATIDNHVYWLSRTREGQCIVISGGGYAATRISTYAIETEFQTYTRVDDAVGYTYQINGHMFYVLAFPHMDRTWAYDVTTGLWTELVWLDSNGT
jgi:hypothetical protein